LDAGDINNNEGMQQISLRNLLYVIFKHKTIILTFFIAAVAIVTTASFMMQPVFKATATILVEKEMDSEKALLFRLNLAQGSGNYDFLNSEIEIMSSYPIAARVVEKYQEELLPEDDEMISLHEKKLIYESTIHNFIEQIEIENPKNSNILKISYENEDPRLAKDIINNFINTYISYRSEIAAESGTYKFLEDQMGMADQKLRDLEQRQADYKGEKELGSPDAQRAILLNRLADYERSLTAVRTRRMGKEAKLAVINDQLQQGQSQSIPTTESSDSPSRVEHIGKLKGELLDLEIRREQLLQKFTPQYEEVVNLDRQIEEIKIKIVGEIKQILREEQTSIRALLAEERVLQNSINNIKREIRDLAQKEYELEQLSRGIEDEREIYSMLLKQREEARISLAKLERGVKIKVISPAVMSTKPVKPKKRLNIILAILLGCFGGVGLAFFKEYFDHTINTPEEIEHYTGIPVLGSVREIRFSHNNDPATIHSRRLLN
jgi:uncharacterized protein involved in exopolysaccharide biosynthesis